MISVRMEPQHKELLPPSIRDSKTETVLSYKTLVAKDMARFYDKDGKETGSSKLKPTRFTALVEKILASGEAAKGQVASEVMGHPLINEAYILGLAHDKQAEVKTNGPITEIRFDLSRFASEANEPTENLSKYSVQYYNFRNKRMLGEKLYDKNGDKVLYRSTIFYSPADKGNQVEKTLSEAYNEEPKTGVKTKLMKQTFYTNMKVDVNI